MQEAEAIAVKSHGRATAYLISVHEYEELQRYKRMARQSFATAELSEGDIKAIARSRMGDAPWHRRSCGRAARRSAPHSSSPAGAA